MKILNFSLLAVLVSTFFCMPSMAQQTDHEITLQLSDADNPEPKMYPLKSVNYTCSSSPDDSTYSAYQQYALSFELRQNLDPFLLKWINGELKDAKGVVKVANRESGKVVRTLEFEGKTAGTTSESFTSGGDYGYLTSSLSIYTSKLTVDGVKFVAPGAK